MRRISLQRRRRKGVMVFSGEGDKRRAHRSYSRVRDFVAGRKDTIES